VAYDWPGNVRELRNVAERFVLLGELDCGEAGELQSNMNTSMSLPERIEYFEKTLIQTELARHAGSIKETLAALGLPRKTLSDKMRKYGLDKADYK
jgi:two-component system C4-dicarboxylate transport response regulator DctD